MPSNVTTILRNNIQWTNKCKSKAFHWKFLSSITYAEYTDDKNETFNGKCYFCHSDNMETQQLFLNWKKSLYFYSKWKMRKIWNNIKFDKVKLSLQIIICIWKKKLMCTANFLSNLINKFNHNHAEAYIFDRVLQIESALQIVFWL